ncbi:MAG TPA: hypothetical protein VMV48_07955 [Gallionellaceae bacterium]|nr:hypothetical protein [Gallionellaceae bacterium]
MAFFVLSERGSSKSPAQACVNEFEDVLINLLNAQLICPNTASGSSIDIDRYDSGKEKIVFVICISEYKAYQSLTCIKNWRKKFDKVIIYVFDSYPVSREMGWIRKKLSRSIRALSEVDHIFVALSGGVEKFESDFSAPVSFVPLAADVLKFGSGRSNRCISINAYGRQHLTHSKMLAEYFNNTENCGSYLHTNHTEIGQLHDYVSHRRQFWKLLSISNIAMAYDPMVVNRTGANAFTFSFIGQRWFESLAAGCLVVGRRPTCSETKDYLDWDDATVELPKNDGDVIPFLEEILNDSDRLESAHKRNYMNSLLKNDWRHRLVDIFDHLKLYIPQGIRNEIEEMAAMAHKIQQDF